MILRRTEGGDMTPDAFYVLFFVLGCLGLWYSLREER